MRLFVVFLIAMSSLVAAPRKTGVRHSPAKGVKVKMKRHKGGRLTPRKGSANRPARHLKTR